MSMDWPPILYEPPKRYTSRTNVFVPVLVHLLRAGAVMALEWTTLDHIEGAPRLVKAATFVIALLILAVVESRDWLNFKGRFYFPAFAAFLILVWLVLAGYGYFFVVPAIRSVATAFMPAPAVVVREGPSSSDIAKITKPLQNHIASLKDQLASEEAESAKRNQNWDIHVGRYSGGPISPETTIALSRIFSAAAGVCLVKATSGPDNANLGETLVEIAIISNPHLCVEEPDKVPPDIDQIRQLNSAAGIIVHYAANNELGAKVARLLFSEGGFNVSTKHELYWWDDPNLIWFDIGPGRPGRLP
jgi:hypothetical protein